MLRFLIIMGISTTAAVFLFSFWLIPTLLLSRLLNRTETPNRLVLFLFNVYAAPSQAVFWVIWAIYCALLTTVYAFHAGHWAWLYYTEGFSFAMTPLSYLTSAEYQVKETEQERQSMIMGSFIYSLITAATFIGAALWRHFVR